MQPPSGLHVFAADASYLESAMRARRLPRGRVEPRRNGDQLGDAAPRAGGISGETVTVALGDPG
ncbi:MAG: hypothetical protein M3022_02590 [Actinomycetota bacterium]|nr:hypothetical protein [Actinomycetota bacterium]